MADELRTIPRAPGALPGLGHIWQLWRRRRELLRFVEALGDTGPLVRVDVGTLPILFVTRPELAHELMVKKAGSFEKGRLFTRMRPMVGDGLATAATEVNRRHRRLMQPAFHRARIAGYGEVMSSRAIALAESWTPGQLLAVDQVMGEHAIETLARTMFSADIGQAAVEVVRRDVPTILKNMLLRAVFPPFLDRLPITANREFDAAAARLRQVIDEVIAAARRSGDTDHPDLLSMLLAARDADTGEALTDTEVRDELVTILFAGTETAGSTLAWAFHEIAGHPEVEERLLLEIDAVVATRPVALDDVAKLEYTGRVIQEVLRQHSVTLLMRRAVEPVELGGYAIPTGTEVAFSLYALHRRLDPDAGRFDPDRWLPERRQELSRASFMPFGAGGRQCIGDAYASAEMVITLAAVLARWRLRPEPGHTPREAVAAMPHPDHLPMRVVPRSG
ncbi:cytochrome P450 [Streptacidiphilus carbonis]|uniref:cytochrome P450 n=1 Tax=Streptacidiphilus carbonis TaxID=105422 RepID=UPI0009FEDD44|nr:cytochrome P450 [Streptacidiphilus carbonis]